jgi:hypothetical protein
VDDAVCYMTLSDEFSTIETIDTIPGNQITITKEGKNRIKGAAYIG